MQRIAVHAAAATDLAPAFSPTIRLALQLSPGRMRASADVEVGEQHRLAVGTTSHALALHGSVGEERLLLVALQWSAGEPRWAGQAQAPAACMLLGPGTPVDLQLPAGARFAFLHVAANAFGSICFAQGLRQVRNCIHGPGLHQLATRTAAPARLLRSSLRRSTRWAHPSVAEDRRIAFRLAVFATLVETLWSQRLALALPLTRQQSLGLAIASLSAETGPTPLMSDLAQLARTSQRSLEYAFHASYGVTPSRFAKLARLSAAQAQLRTNPEEGVSGVARNLHFGHLGKFAGDYSLQFGERPSDTLRWRQGPSIDGASIVSPAASRRLWRMAARLA